MADNSSPATPRSLPIHLGLILDGNRRWARARGLPTLLGHKRGYDKFRTISEAAFDRGVKYVSGFIFSTENWSRSKDEVDYLMDLALKIFAKDLKGIHKKGIKVLWFGVKDKLSQKHLDAIRETEELTKNNTHGTLCVCFNYGGRREIADAVNKLIVQNIKPGDVTEQLIEDNLYHPEVPPIDMVVRTSSEQRISNFMLWRLAYAELLFVKKDWPAFTEKDLDIVLEEFALRHRRFGK